MSNTVEYKEALFFALSNIFEMYEERLKGQHKHVGRADIGTYISVCAPTGAAIGSVVPGIGNAIGAVSGTLSGLFTACFVELYYCRMNKKLDNAIKVDDSLGENDRDTLKEIANKVIEERKSIIENLENTEKNKNQVANYLAVNIMAAIKHDGGHTKSSIVDVAAEGLRNPRSRKEASDTLRNIDGSSITLKQLARCNFFQPHTASLVDCQTSPAA